MTNLIDLSPSTQNEPTNPVQLGDLDRTPVFATVSVPVPGPVQGILFITDDTRNGHANGHVSEMDRRKFERLVDWWHRDTDDMAVLSKAFMHKAYQRIIGMGKPAIPLLLNELQHRPDYWFWALRAITEEDVSQSSDTFDGAVQAWLRWGKEQGYIHAGVGSRMAVSESQT